jgi:preprotein translocase subunit YajC
MTPDLALLLLQPSPGAGGGGTSIQGIVFQVLMFVGIFYFLLIRPQQKQRKQQEQSLLALKKGDDIVTAGGLVGQVVHIDQKTADGAPAPALDDRITIRSGEAKLVVERGKIARVSRKDVEPAAGA